MPRAVFMGSPEFAIPSLIATTRVCDVPLVVCQPDRPAGRGRKLKPPAVKLESERLGLTIAQPRKMRDGTLAAQLRDLDLDFIVVTAFGRILPEDVLAVPRSGCINVHASVLPRWRGAAPIQRAILAGDTESGVSIMQMDPGMDTGPVYRIVSLPIGAEETAGELSERLSRLGGEALEDFLGSFDDAAPPTPQDDALATHAPPLKKEEGEIDWHRTVHDLVCHVRGMDPWPTSFVRTALGPLKLFRARPSPREFGADQLPGNVAGCDEHGLHVACLDGVLQIAELQPPGKRRMDAAAYARGHELEAGDQLG